MSEVKVLSDTESHISCNPMPPYISEVLTKPGLPQGVAIYNAVGEYISKLLEECEEVDHIDIVLQLPEDQRIDGIGILRVKLDVIPAEKIEVI